MIFLKYLRVSSQNIQLMVNNDDPQLNLPQKCLIYSPIHYLDILIVITIIYLYIRSYLDYVFFPKFNFFPSYDVKCNTDKYNR